MSRGENIGQRLRDRSLPTLTRKGFWRGCIVVIVAVVGLGVMIRADWFWAASPAAELPVRRPGVENPRPVTLSSTALANPTNPDAPSPGSAYFRALPFLELDDGDDATAGTRAARKLLIRTNNGDAASAEAEYSGRSRNGFDEYQRAVFLNTVADIQQRDERLLDNAIFTAFYYGDRKDALLPFGIVLTGVTQAQLDQAKLDISGILGIFGRRSPKIDSVASLEATRELDGSDKWAFDVDLYNLKSDPDKHMAEVNFNQKFHVTTHPADVSRALELRGILSGVFTG